MDKNENYFRNACLNLIYDQINCCWNCTYSLGEAFKQNDRIELDVICRISPYNNIQNISSTCSSYRRRVF